VEDVAAFMDNLINSIVKDNYIKVYIDNGKKIQKLIF